MATPGELQPARTEDQGQTSMSTAQTEEIWVLPGPWFMRLDTTWAWLTIFQIQRKIPRHQKSTGTHQQDSRAQM